MPDRTKKKATKAPRVKRANSSDEVRQKPLLANGHENEYAWPPIYDFPDEQPKAVLAFHGLMGFAYNKSRRFCHVGMHSEAPTHEFAIKVYSDTTTRESEPFYTYNCGSLAGQEAPMVALDIVSANRDYCPPRFYMNRDSNDYDDYDFRRVVDFESHLFYNRRVHLNPSVFKPGLRLKSGVFFTACPTRKNYYRIAGDDCAYLGKLAEIVGAAIYHEPDGYVVLRIAEHELKLPPRTDQPYLIFFENLCPVVNSSEADATKELPNDFHLYYDTFEIPEGREEYEFVSQDSDVLVDKMDRVSLQKQNKKREPDAAPEWLQVFQDFFTRSSRESPCGESGFGKTEGGLPVGH